MKKNIHHAILLESHAYIWLDTIQSPTDLTFFSKPDDLIEMSSFEF